MRERADRTDQRRTDDIGDAVAQGTSNSIRFVLTACHRPPLTPWRWDEGGTAAPPPVPRPGPRSDEPLTRDVVHDQDTRSVHQETDCHDGDQADREPREPSTHRSSLLYQ